MVALEITSNSVSGMAGRVMRHALALVLLLGLWPTASAAQTPSSSPDPVRFVLWTGGDVKAFGRGFFSMRTLYVAAGVGGTVFLLSGQDADLTQGAIDLAEGAGTRPRRILNEVGNVDAVRPMALIFFLGTLTSGNERLQDAAFTSLEAIIISNLITNTLKAVVGRARPFQEEGASSFKPFSGNTSFPSGHATTVFAFTTPWLLYYHNAPTIALFALGAGTAFTRMADNVHWFSDVLIGTAIGFTTGYWLSKRHQRESTRVSVTPVVGNQQTGLFVRVKF